MSDTVEVAAVEQSALLKSVIEMLNGEKWTRATLGNYSERQFKELDELLKEARADRAWDDVKKACDEHLSRTKNSIIALYLSGMIALSRQIIDDATLVSLVTIFVDNHKWNIVRYLCERILDYGESKFALRTLGDCYRNDNEEEKLIGIWERLVKADYEEADLAKALAENAEKQGNTGEAVEYYKKALHRYVNKQLFANVREIWAKLLEYCPEDIEFFLHVQKRIAKSISDDRAIILLKDVCASCRSRNDTDTAISILKLILEYDERDSKARAEIIECFRGKYADHSQLEEYIRVSNLSQGYRNVHEAIQDFEKHIAFDRGNFVYHRTWGVGRIATIKDDEIVIDFTKQRGHKMSLKMAVNALQTLPKEHIWVLKAVWKKEKLHDKVKNEPEWALKTVIRSFGNSCDLKRIKAELVPSVLAAGEWNAWNTKAREVLKSDPSLGVSQENIDLYTVRDRPISREEKLYNEFKAERGFFERAQTLRTYLSGKDADPGSEYFSEMHGWFTAFLRPGSQVNEQVIAAYLLCRDIAGRFPRSQVPQPGFAELFEAVEDVPQVYLGLRDAKFREEFLNSIKLFVPSWPDIYISLFPWSLSPSIIASLEREGYAEKLSALVRRSFENYRDYREAVIWFYKNSLSSPWFSAAGISGERVLITLIHILDLSLREIENHRDVTENRKTAKQAHQILFKGGTLAAFVDSSGEDAILRVFAYLEDVKDLDPADWLALRSRILAKFPDFKFSPGTERTTVSRGLTVTLAKYEEKRKELSHIMEVEVPQNSKDIAFALSLGDLRENAEYKAAKEKQDLLNSRVAKLKDEIDRAQLFDPATVNTGHVSFGTKVRLFNSQREQEEDYTILGPWESDPENRIISYLSPFGGALLNKKVGETFEFLIGGEKAGYTVREITAAL